MGVLGKAAILSNIEAGSILCYPKPHEDQLQLASLDVTLGSNFWFPKMSLNQDMIIDTSMMNALDYYELIEANESITLPPKVKVLGHTNESIGTTVPWLVPSLQCRSTAARWGIQIAACAGWGDPGFCGRWTLEITNTLEVPISIRLGSRIGQVLFYHVEGATPNELYDRAYNQSHDNWKPEHMLPKNLNL